MNQIEHLEQIFMELYNQYADDVFRFAIIRLRNREKAIDITQDTFYKVWNELKKDPKKASTVINFRAFLFTIARNTLIDSTRKKSAIPFSALAKSFIDTDSTSSFLEPPTSLNIYVDPEKQHDLSTIFEHLKLLDEQYREIIIFRYVHELSINEIADIYHISENTASVRIHRALEHARKKLSHLYE